MKNKQAIKQFLYKDVLSKSDALPENAKDEKIIPEFLRINFKKFILSIILMFALPALLSPLFYFSNSDFTVEIMSMEIFYWLPAVFLIFHGILGLVFYLFMLYFFACSIILFYEKLKIRKQ